jgi:hypothetical protein
MQAFHRYANWLVGISWKRFIVLSILLMIVAAHPVANCRRSAGA